MEMSLVIAGLIAGTVVAAFVEPPPGGDLYDVDLRQLADAWTEERVSPADPGSMKYGVLLDHLRSLTRKYPDTLSAEKAGSSVEGRGIYLVSAGKGPKRILFWSQMHGDESTATNALIDLFVFLGRHRQDPWVGKILESYTLLFMPMLNPDGAERNRRRNAQELDINRDARVLQTPEGRLLKTIRDRYEPFLGFNLHNQSSLTTIGNTGRVATLALLAVGADARPVPRESNVLGPDTLLTKRISAVLYEALSPFVYGHISRYDESINPRAFGDNMTLWGTPTVLIESGGHASEHPPDFTVKLNFVGILAVLDSLASGKISNANPAVYDALQMNSEVPIFDLLLRDAWIFTGRAVPIFRGDLAVRRDLRAGGNSEALIADIGDLGVFTAHRTLDCSGAMLTPGLIAWSAGSAFGSAAGDANLLRAGVTTVIETADWDRVGKTAPAPAEWTTRPRILNHAYLVDGPTAGTEAAEIKLARWLAAGGRAVVSPISSAAEARSRLSEIADWFGLESLPREQAARYGIPQGLQGDPVSVLPRWTSEAASRFRIPRRGSIALGNVADLVIWKSASAGAPEDLRNYRPSGVILNGNLLNLEDPESFGRFLGK